MCSETGIMELEELPLLRLKEPVGILSQGL